MSGKGQLAVAAEGGAQANGGKQDALVPFKRQIEGLKPYLVSLLKGSGLTPERIASVLLVEARLRPDLLKCDFPSIARCVMLASQLGLEPGSILGHFYLIPRWNSRLYANEHGGFSGGQECTPLIGYKGYADCAMRSGQIVAPWAKVVYKGDHFREIGGTDPRIEHIPDPSSDHRDENIVAAYAVVKLQTGGIVFDVMSKSDIDFICERNGPRNQKGDIVGPWITDYARMCRKSPFRRLMAGGEVPLTRTMALAIAADGDASDAERKIAQAHLNETMREALAGRVDEAQAAGVIDVEHVADDDRPPEVNDRPKTAARPRVAPSQSEPPPSDAPRPADNQATQKRPPAPKTVAEAVQRIAEGTTLTIPQKRLLFDHLKGIEPGTCGLNDDSLKVELPKVAAEWAAEEGHDLDAFRDLVTAIKEG